MTTTTNYPESPEGSSPTNCPHCGAEAETLNYYACDTNILEDIPSNLCMERAARQKAEAELAEAKADSESWRNQCARWESQLLAKQDELVTERSARQKAEAEVNDTWKQEEDWHRWAREVLSDWATPFDDHKAGLRLGITQLLKLKSDQLAETRKELEALRIQSKAYSDGVVDAALKLRDVIQEIRGAWPDNPNGLGGQSVIKAASELLREQAAQLARIREAVRQQCGVAFWDQIAGQQGVTTKAKEGK